MDKFELYINATMVDLKDDFPLSFNFQVSDIAKPESRQASYSKTITMPGSKVNRKLFTNIFDLSSWIDTSGTTNFQPDFNPNLKADAQAFLNGVQVFDGIAQLDSINVTDNGLIEFNVVLLGNLIDLFKTIGDEDLSDIDFSDLDHSYSVANITSSWSPTFGTGYVYPLIDYGYSTDLQTFPFQNFKPAIFVKEYVDRIFSDAGFVYDSDFFTSDFFKHLIVPFNGADFTLTADQVTDRLFRAERTTDLAVTTTTILFNDDSTPPNFDNSGLYTPANGRFTVSAGYEGTYELVADLNLETVMTPDTSGVTVKALREYAYIVNFIKVSGGVSTIVGSGSVAVQTDPFTTSLTTNSGNSTWSGVNAVGTGRVVVSSGQIQLAAGDYVTCRVGVIPYSWQFGAYVQLNAGANDLFYNSGTNTYYEGTVTHYVKADSVMYNLVSSATYIEGNTISMGAAIQPNIKKKDFLLWLIRMFNLYIQPDADVTNKLKIEPRDDYYTGTVVDWTDKHDISKETTIKPMGALEAKRYEFKYKDDSDYFNKRYQDTWVETYGQYNTDIINDFIKDTKTIEVGFSATPLVGSNLSDRIISRIISVDNNGVISTAKGNPRILYFKGIKASNFTWYIESNSGLNTYSSGYPYAGHLDDPYSPTVDLSWGVPREIYYTSQFGTITYTNSNLYNNYYRKMIYEVTNRNSKIVLAWFNLNSLDIQQLDFRKLYYFNREYFRLNRVIGYNPLNPSVTQCEFLRIQEGLTFSATTSESNGVGEINIKPDWNIQFTDYFNFTDNNNNSTYGKKNYIGDGATGIVNGDQNIVGYGVKNVFVQGDENIVQAGSSGVTVIGEGNRVNACTNFVAINTNNLVGQSGRNNLTFINGRIMGGKWYHSKTTSTEKTYDTDWEHSLILADATDGNVTIELPAPVDEWGKPPMTIKRTDSTANTVTVDASTNGGLIDGASNYLLVQYEAIRIYSDGLTWHIV